MQNQEPIKIVQINKNRFELYMLGTRKAIVKTYTEEIDYYSSDDGSLLGLILFDYTDRYFNYLIFARDENNQFRAFEIKIDFQTKEEAIEMLMNSMKWHVSQGLKMVNQKVPTQGVNLFKLVVTEKNLHPYFVRLSKEKGFFASRRAIIEMANHLDDLDGNFVEQFQSVNGFDARLWELYLFASLLELDFEISTDYDRPDFLVQKDSVSLAIEATIVGRKNNPPKYLMSEEDIATPIDINKKLQSEVPLKYGSALFSKLKKEYWKLDHVKGIPLLFAIADFHDNASMTWSFSALTEYLYGTKPIIIKDDKGGRKVEHKKVGSYKKDIGAEILSGFFNEEDAKNVSGVLFSSTGTLSKFTRMGIQAGFREKGQSVFRIGDRYDHRSDRFEPISFGYEVNENGTETWSEGLNLFHNPNAIHPVDMELFPGIAHHKLKGEELVSWVPEFHPFASININNNMKD